MATAVSFATGDPVTVKCFTFKTPESVNEPMGEFQLWIDGSNVEGRMTITVLAGWLSKTSLNLTGSLTGANPLDCTLQGTGVVVQHGQPARSVELGVNLSMAADSTTGQLTFSTNGTAASGGLPVQLVDCPRE